jgi:2-polyprenyl-3-methyl-5-hydroxy-6-metoxy-1,4-benzoquinol methylase
VSDLTPPHECPGCLGTGRWHPLVVEGWRLAICRRCGTQWLENPHPPAADGYWKRHKFAVYGGDHVQAQYAARYDRLLSIARETDSVESVLDVGCGSGNFLAYAGEIGIRAVGVDVDPRAVEAARERGCDAHLPGDLDEAEFDAVTLWDVIEHVTDPDSLLKEATDRLRPGGALLMETPDGRFFVRRALLALYRVSSGRVNLTRPLYYPEHKIYFSESGLRAMLARAGIHVVQVVRLNSPRAKMTKVFAHNARNGSPLAALLRLAWPTLEAVARLFRAGNKILLVAR